MSFLTPFLVYLYTLAPTVTLEDSGELITAATTLGIAHPPGYPLYCALGKLFTLLPIGSSSDIAFRVNLMSAFFAALSCLMLYFILLRLSCKPFIAFMGACIGGFSKVFWSQAVIAEVYTLHAFLFLLNVYILILWKDLQDKKYLFLFSFVYGLGLTNHTALILYAPIFIAFITIFSKPLPSLKVHITCLLAFFLGLSFYLYIPLRMGAHGILNFGNLHSIQDIFSHVARLQYQTLDFASSVSIQEKFLFIKDLFFSISHQFGPAIWILGILGFIAFQKKNIKLNLIFLMLFLIGTIGIILIRNFHFTPKNIFISRVYFINSYLIFALYIGWGLQFIVNIFSRRLIYIPISIIIFLPLLTHFSANNQRNNRFTSVHAKNILRSLPSSAYLLFVYEDDILFPLVYTHRIQGIRPDITIIDAYGAIYREALGKELCQSCPKDMISAQQFQKGVVSYLESKGVKHMYFSKPGHFKKSQFSNDGLFYTKKNSKHSGAAFLDYYGQTMNYPLSGHHFFENSLKANYTIRYAELLYNEGHQDKAREQFKKAIRLNHQDHALFYVIAQIFTSKGEYKDAETHFLRSLHIHPHFPEAYNGLGAIALKQKNFPAAIKHFKKGLSLATYNRAPIHFNLGYALLKNGNTKQAYFHLKHAHHDGPDNYFASYHLGKAARALGKESEAQKLFKNLIKQLPTQTKHLKKLISQGQKSND